MFENARRKVLIVDDDENISFGVEQRLRAAGYDTCMASNAQECLEMTRLQRPDVVLLDVRMPGMDGMETLAHLQEEERSSAIPVIMLSASLAEQQAALDAGARFFVRKPYDHNVLLSAIEQAVREL